MKLNPYYAFDESPKVKPFLKSFKELHRKICIGIAKSEKHLFISHGPDRVFCEKMIHYTQPLAWEDPRIRDDFGEDLAGLTTGELKEFFRAYRSHIFNNYFLPLRGNKGVYDFTRAFHAADTTEHPNAKHFPELMALIKTLPFEEIGRIYFLYTPPNQEELWHIDYWPGEEFYDGTRHFMWISTQKSLRMEVDGKIIDIDSSCMLFDYGNKHSTPISSESAYSLRIEGQFTKEFAEEHGLLWKKR